MKKPFLTLFLMLISISATFSQKNKNVRSLLWKVEYPGTNHHSYILGTNHGIGQDWLNKFSFLKQLISSSDAMYTETGNMPRAELAVDAIKVIPAKNLGTLFGKDSLLVDSFMTSYLMLPQPFSQILTSPAICQSGFESQKKFLFGFVALMDVKLLSDLSIQKGFKKDTFHIEKIEVLDNLLEQIAASQIPLLPLDNEKDLNDLFQSEKFDPAQITVQIKDIKKFLKGKKSKSAKFLEKELDLFYKGQREIHLTRRTKITPSLKKITIDRNNQWVIKLSTELKEKNLFVAFGAAHLFMMDRYGVLDQLKKEGFTVTPIDMLEYAANSQTVNN